VGEGPSFAGALEDFEGLELWIDEPDDVDKTASPV